MVVENEEVWADDKTDCVVDDACEDDAWDELVEEEELLPVSLDED